MELLNSPDWQIEYRNQRLQKFVITTTPYGCQINDNHRGAGCEWRQRYCTVSAMGTVPIIMASFNKQTELLRFQLLGMVRNSKKFQIVSPISSYSQ